MLAGATPFGGPFVLIKSADHKQPQIVTLEALLARPDADAETRRRIEIEIRKVRAGIAGERDAAYEIEFVLGRSPRWATIHDLRLEVDGRVAQLDHIVINHLLDVWVVESKHFSDGVAVDEHGEWVGFFGGRPYGIPSPIEQNRRHIDVLAAAFKSGRVPLPKRLGIVTIQPAFHSLVLVSNHARISRPKSRAAAARVDGLDMVMKAEQFGRYIDKFFDQRSVASAAKLVSSEAVEAVAHSLVGMHVPATVDWAARFGLPAAAPVAPEQQPVPAAEAPATARLACGACGRRVSAAVVDFCAARPERFAGGTYCMSCQGRYRRSPERETEPRRERS